MAGKQQLEAATDSFGSIELIADTRAAIVEMEETMLILARLVVTQAALDKRWSAETSASFPDYPEGDNWKVGFTALMASPFGDLDRLTYRAISLLHGVEGDDPATDPDVAPYLQAVVTTDPTPAEREDGPESPQCTCSRCGRVTSEMAKDFCEWEVEEDGETMICPGCLTSGEEAAIYEDVELTSMKIKHHHSINQGDTP
jgi:hypothetical protein